MIELTRVERLILANQFAILAKLDPDETSHYAHAEEALRFGYELAYDWHLYVCEDKAVLSAKDCSEVNDILMMFRVLRHGYDQLQDKNGVYYDAIKYHGFDGNNETKQYGYTQFLKSEGKYQELVGSDGDNSHAEMLSRYRQLLRAWNNCEDKYNPTRDDIVRNCTYFYGIE